MLGCIRCVLLSSWRACCTSLTQTPLLTQREEICSSQQTLSSSLLHNSQRKPGNAFNAWMSAVDIKANTIKQTTQHRSDNNINNSKGKSLPVRGIYATRPLIQGERIAHISEESILTGERAADIIRTIVNSLTKTELDLTALDEYFTSPRPNSINSSSSSSPSISLSSSSSSLECEQKQELLEKTVQLRTTANNNSTPNSIRLRSFTSFVNALREITSDLPFYLMASRDCLLITVAIFLLRLISFSSITVAEGMNVQVIQQWISSLPPRIPPLGLLLHQHYSQHNSFEPLQRRVQLGKYSKMLSPHESIHDAHKSLLLAALQEDNDNTNTNFISSTMSSSIEESENNHRVESSLVIPENKNNFLTNVLSSLQPTTKICITPQLMKHYFKNEGSALSERQHIHQRGEARNKLIRWQEEELEHEYHDYNNNSMSNNDCKNSNAALRELMRLELEIHKKVLSPLVLALVEFNNCTNCKRTNKSHKIEEYVKEEEDEDEENSSLMKLMEWSHFMMRSRVINLHWLAVQRQDHAFYSLHNTSSCLLQWALVPFIDMLNHEYDNVNINVNFSFKQEDKSINVYTTSSIAPEQELCVHYGHLAQRGGVLSNTMKEWSLNTLLLTSSTMANTIYNKNCNSANSSSVIRTKRDMVAAEVETIENKQKMLYGLDVPPSLEIYSQMAIERLSPNVALLESEKEKFEEMHTLANTNSSSNIDESESKQYVHRSLSKEYKHISHETKRIHSLVSNSNTHKSSPSMPPNKKSSSSSSSSYVASGGKQKISLREAHIASAEGVAEGRWLWRFGFHRSEGEIVHEAQLLWSSQLRNRIARLTDVRRKGRPGEFVLGVPENLAMLREQRATLERERYHNQRIFPPQRE